MKIRIPHPKLYFEYLIQLELRICKPVLAYIILTIQIELMQVSSQIVDIIKRLFQFNNY